MGFINNLNNYNYIFFNNLKYSKKKRVKNANQEKGN